MMPGLVQTRAFSYFEHAHRDPRRVTITRTDQLEEMVRRLSAAPVRADDTEGSGLRWDLSARIAGVAWACYRDEGDIQAYYLPFRHQTGESQLSEDVVRRVLHDLYYRTRPDQVRVWWNRKFDDHMMRREGIFLTDHQDIDAMIEARLFDENTPAKLKDRALIDLGELEAHVHEEILKRELVRLAGLHGLKKEDYLDRYGYAQIPIFMAGSYACRDVEYTLRLHRKYSEAGVRSHYSRSPRGPQFWGIWNTEMVLARVLCDVEEWGLPINRGYVDWLRQDTMGAIERLDAGIWDVLGHHRRFNLDSDEELRFFLTRSLGLQLYKYTRGGELAVDREVLEEFSAEAPVLLQIKERREAKKLATTYTNSLLEWCDGSDIIHGNYQQMGTDTGRASMTEPNLQNIASDSDTRSKAATGKKLKDGGRDPWSVRRAFPVRWVNGIRWPRLYIDWSQVELRVLTDASGDPNLTLAYRNGEDLHTQTTRLIYGHSLSKGEEAEKRRTSKVANFGDSYMMTAVGLARKAKIPLEEAEDFMRRRAAAYPGIGMFRSRLFQQARANGGWFANKYGRTRRIPELMSGDEKEFRRACRKAIASRIQGEAGDFAKEKMVQLDAFLRAHKLRARIAGWVHDEIAIDAPPEEFVFVARGARAVMQHAPDYSIPMVADVSYTMTDWSEKAEVPGL
jgi:DNA polymerase-1